MTHSTAGPPTGVPPDGRAAELYAELFGSREAAEQTIASLEQEGSKMVSTQIVRPQKHTKKSNVQPQDRPFSRVAHQHPVANGPTSARQDNRRPKGRRRVGRAIGSIAVATALLVGSVIGITPTGAPSQAQAVTASAAAVELLSTTPQGVTDNMPDLAANVSSDELRDIAGDGTGTTPSVAQPESDRLEWAPIVNGRFIGSGLYNADGSITVDDAKRNLIQHVRVNVIPLVNYARYENIPGAEQDFSVFYTEDREFLSEKGIELRDALIEKWNSAVSVELLHLDGTNTGLNDRGEIVKGGQISGDKLALVSTYSDGSTSAYWVRCGNVWLPAKPPSLSPPSTTPPTTTPPTEPPPVIEECPEDDETYNPETGLCEKHRNNDPGDPGDGHGNDTVTPLPITGPPTDPTPEPTPVDPEEEPGSSIPGDSDNDPVVDGHEDGHEPPTGPPAEGEDGQNPGPDSPGENIEEPTHVGTTSGEQTTGDSQPVSSPETTQAPAPATEQPVQQQTPAPEPAPQSDPAPAPVVEQPVQQQAPEPAPEQPVQPAPVEGPPSADESATDTTE